MGNMYHMRRCGESWCATIGSSPALPRRFRVPWETNIRRTIRRWTRLDRMRSAPKIGPSTNDTRSTKAKSATGTRTTLARLGMNEQTWRPPPKKTFGKLQHTLTYMAALTLRYYRGLTHASPITLATTKTTYTGLGIKQHPPLKR